MDGVFDVLQPKAGDDENDFVNRYPMKNGAEVLQVPDYVHAVHAFDSTAGFVLNGADDSESPFRMVVDLPEEQFGSSSSSDDEELTEIKAAPARLVHDDENEYFLDQQKNESGHNKNYKKQAAHEGKFKDEE
jgi:hypothetical protein